MGLLDKIETWGTLAFIGIAGYVVWSNWDRIIKGFCSIPGVDLAFPQWCGQPTCPEGSVMENGICKPIKPPDPCPAGTLWRDGVCVPFDVDKPGVCVPPKVWDYILKRCMTPQPGKKNCPDGSWVYEYQTCPGQPLDCSSKKPWEPCGNETTIDGYPVERMCAWITEGVDRQDGNYCMWETVAKTLGCFGGLKNWFGFCHGETGGGGNKLVQCPDGGLAQLLPGMSVKQSCDARESLIVINKHYGDCLVQVMHKCKADWGDTPECVQMADDCRWDTSRNNLATRKETRAWIDACPGVVGTLPPEINEESWCANNGLGWTCLSSLTKGYIGNPDWYPGHDRLICFQRQ